MTEAPFDLVEVARGRQLHACLGGPVGAPCVVFDHGAFGFYGDGWWLRAALKRQFRVLLYERAGMGYSDPAPDGARLSAEWHVEDLRQLLDGLNLRRPYILVGHSMAGLRLHAFANLYRDELKGLVFVDAMHPHVRRNERQLRLLRAFAFALRAGGLAARAGLIGLAAPMLRDEFNLPAQRAKEKRHIFDHAKHWDHSRREVLDFDPVDACFVGDLASTLPTAVFSCAPNGGANARVARASLRRTGIGDIRATPHLSHTSILNRSNAAKIAEAVIRIHEWRGLQE